MIENVVASGQAKNFFSTQSIPGSKSSILKHIHFYEANKFKTLKSDEYINDHIDMSIHSIEMPFESTPSFYLNLIEKLKYMKPVEDLICVHEVCMLDDCPQFMKKVIRDNLATRAHYMEQVKSYYKDEGDNNGLLL